MDRKFLLGILVAVAVIFFAAAFAQNLAKSTAPPVDRETLYQVSTIDALMQGAFEGVEPVTEIKKHGDFGIGTFDALDGEMVALDRTYYQIKSDGYAYPVPDSATTPFATVTFFEPDFVITTDRQMNYSELSGYISGHLPSKNMIYAVRMHGTFPAMKVRKRATAGTAIPSPYCRGRKPDRLFVFRCAGDGCRVYNAAVFFRPQCPRLPPPLHLR